MAETILREKLTPSFPRKRESRAPRPQRLPPVQARGRLWTPAVAGVRLTVLNIISSLSPSDVSPDIRSNHLVGRQGQEFGKGRGFDQLAEEPGRVVVTAAVSGGFAQFRELLVEDGTAQRDVDDAAVLELRAVPDPLPDLSAADLRGRRVLHQIVERHAAGAAQPGLDIADPDIEVLSQAGLGDRALGNNEKIGRADMDILALARDLVGLRHVAIEDLVGDRHQAGMGYPGAVMAVAGLA